MSECTDNRDTPRNAMPAITQDTRIRTNIATLVAALSSIVAATIWCTSMWISQRSLEATVADLRAEMHAFMTEVHAELQTRKP